VVWDAGRSEVVHEVAFEPLALLDAVERVREALPGVGIALLSASTMHLDAGYASLRGKGAAGAETFTNVGRVVADHRIVMVSVRHPRHTAQQSVGAVAAAFGDVGVASFAGLVSVDVAPASAKKVQAVAEELAAAGCPPGATVAFGDMPNDLPLLGWAGWACAVVNAHPSVLEAADEIVPSNDDDGVAVGVRRLLGV
jgi:hydroxymethylpyrimidine pyrophosphatase-like HAD family hydrolase